MNIFEMLQLFISTKNEKPFESGMVINCRHIGHVFATLYHLFRQQMCNHPPHPQNFKYIFCVFQSIGASLSSV